MSSSDIVIRGITVDLEKVYARMERGARETADGRLIFDGGLKYVLGEMLSLEVDAGTPKQPLADIRRETVRELRRRGWILETNAKNNGRYELTR